MRVLIYQSLHIFLIQTSYIAIKKQNNVCYRIGIMQLIHLNYNYITQYNIVQEKNEILPIAD